MLLFWQGSIIMKLRLQTKVFVELVFQLILLHMMLVWLYFALLFFTKLFSFISYLYIGMFIIFLEWGFRSFDFLLTWTFFIRFVNNTSSDIIKVFCYLNSESDLECFVVLFQRPTSSFMQWHILTVSFCYLQEATSRVFLSSYNLKVLLSYFHGADLESLVFYFPGWIMRISFSYVHDGLWMFLLSHLQGLYIWLCFWYIFFLFLF